VTQGGRHHRDLHDRGLAGALNANVFKQTSAHARVQGKGAQVSLCIIGTKG